MSSSTATDILNCAQNLCQRRGFNAFSYRDIANKLGIKTASIHYHFATKEKLGEALLLRYHGGFAAQLSKLSAEVRDPSKRIQKFADLLGDALKDGYKLCLCAMLASDLETLEAGMQTQIKLFFEASETWLEATFAEGKDSGAFSFQVTPRLLAKSYLASLHGLAMCARTFKDPARFDAGKNWLIQGLEV